jgi:hypothetical protein
MSRDDARRLAAAVGWLRIGIGAVALVAPAKAMAPFVGSADAGRPATRLLTRGLGGRDIALGVGTVLALRHDGPIRGWVEAGALADAADTLGSLAVFGSLHRTLRWGFLAMSAGAVVTGRMLAPAVD